MYPLRIIETERDGFDQTVVELWRDDEFVGMVFWDGSATVVNIYPGAGDVFDLELDDLVRVLDTAQQIVDPFALETADEEHPATLALTQEFDPQAVHRTEDGEGFFPHPVATSLIERCRRLGLAVVEMEGFDLIGGGLKPRPGMTITIRPPTTPTTFDEFAEEANETAAVNLGNWPARDTMVIAFVIQQPDGETIVL